MKNRPVLFMIIILLFAAMACNFVGCGSDDTSETEPEPAADAAESGEQSSGAAAATAAVKELSDAESSESAAEETTAAATPSIAPTPTDKPAPTQRPTAETTETATASTGSGSTDAGGSSGSTSGSASSSDKVWGETGRGATSACDHPYFPMRTGSTWTYNNGPDTMVWVITDVQGDMNEATAKMTSTVGSLVLNYEWNCTAGDGISSFDFATLGLQDLGTSVTMENMNMGGVFFPPAGDMVPGATWTLTLDGVLSITQDAGGQTVSIDANLVSVQDFEVVSDDPVPFGDQTFDGIQVEEANTISIVMNMLGTEVAQDVSIGSLMQLAYGVGIVRQDYTSDFGSETQTLVDFFIP